MMAAQAGEPSRCAVDRMATRLQASCRGHLDEIVPVHVIHNNLLAPVVTAHPVIPGTGIFNSSLPWQGSSVSPTFPLRQPPQTPLSMD